jgi:hypothetical protein
MPRVVLGQPWYKKPEPETSHCVLTTAALLTEQGIHFSVIAGFRIPLVGHARAAIVAQFMAATVDDDDRLLMVDHDMTWRPEAALRLYMHHLPMVCAVGATKGDWRFIADGAGPEVRPGVTLSQYDEERGLLPVERCGLCFTMVKRSLLERLMKAHPELHAHRQKGLDELRRPFHYGLFETKVTDGIWQSEDFAFCGLVRGIGERVWVDPWITLGHIVSHEVRGRMLDTIEWEDGQMPEPPEGLGDV